MPTAAIGQHGIACIQLPSNRVGRRNLAGNPVKNRVARCCPLYTLPPNHMRYTPNTVYHIYNRGNNKQRIFFSEANYLFFLRKLQKHITPHGEILCWCLMPNHFHLMVYTTESSCAESYGTIKLKIQSLTYWIGIIQSSYARAINKQNGTTGSLFQSKTKAKELSENEKIIRCLHCIHQNPFTAQMVLKPDDWSFSSFRDYAGLRSGTHALRTVYLI